MDMQDQASVATPNIAAIGAAVHPTLQSSVLVMVASGQSVARYAVVWGAIGIGDMNL